jgi:type I restriction enzyme S subunit
MLIRELQTLVEPVRRSTNLNHNSQNNTVYLGLKDVEKGGFRAFPRPVPEITDSLNQKLYFEKGDILYGRLRPNLNKVWLADRPGICSPEFIVLKPISSVPASYIVHMLRSTQVVKWTTQIQRGASLPRVLWNDLRTLGIPIIGSPESQSKFAYILDNIVDSKNARQSCCEYLTTLLSSITYKMFGTPSNHPNDVSFQPLGDLGILNSRPQSGLYKPQRAYSAKNGKLIVRIDSFQGNVLESISLSQRVQISDQEVLQYKLNSGDILINRVNSPDQIGKCALVTDTTDLVVFESNIMRVSPNSNVIYPEVLIAYMTSDYSRQVLRKAAKVSVNQASINQNDVLGLQIPIGTNERQKRFRTIFLALYDINRLLNDQQQEFFTFYNTILDHTYSTFPIMLQDTKNKRNEQMSDPLNDFKRQEFSNRLVWSRFSESQRMMCYACYSFAEPFNIETLANRLKLEYQVNMNREELIANLNLFVILGLVIEDAREDIDMWRIPQSDIDPEVTV